MIYLTTTAPTITAVLDQIAQEERWIDGVELRVDLLDPGERAAVADFPSRVRARWSDRLGMICTVRRVRDGGRSDDSDAERLRIQAAAARAGFHYVDLEADLPDSAAHDELVAAAARAGVGVIRSLHDFERVPTPLPELIRSLPRSSNEVAKCAVTPTSTDDLVSLVAAADRLSGQPRIIIGMGEYGFPTRVLSHRLGNLLTFASAAGEAAAPGHVSAQMLATSYRLRRHNASTRYFAVIGNPISHSRSPEYHNARFAEESMHACYLPILVDDVDAFFRLADAIPILGCSVTIPHKREVIAYLTESGDDVRAADACNTLVRVPSGWKGVNTDVIGFLAPLEEVRTAALNDARVLVLGAGGAARGIVYALLSRGADVILFNRTPQKARALAADMDAYIGSARTTVVDADDAGLPVAPPTAEVVVNATSVGMHGEGDPAAWYEFTGDEIVYDIVYTPPETPMIRRAAAAGCRVITGDRMFAAQAAAQYELYRTMVTADPNVPEDDA